MVRNEAFCFWDALVRELLTGGDKCGDICKGTSVLKEPGDAW